MVVTRSWASRSLSASGLRGIAYCQLAPNKARPTASTASYMVINPIGASTASALALDRHDLGAGLARPGDHRADLLGSLAQRIIGDMSVALRRPRLRVAEQPADDGQVQAAAGPYRRKRVPEVVNARLPPVLVPAELGALPDEMPDVPKRRQRLAGLRPGEDPFAV